MSLQKYAALLHAAFACLGGLALPLVIQAIASGKGK